MQMKLGTANAQIVTPDKIPTFVSPSLGKKGLQNREESLAACER